MTASFWRMIIESIADNASIWISILALLAAILHGFATRRHQKLSVKPLLRIDRSRRLDDRAEIALVNTGIGPALIQSINIKVSDQWIDGANLDWGDNAAKILKENKIIPKNFVFGYGNFFPGESIAVNERFSLIYFEAKNNKEVEDADLFYNTVIFFIKFKIVYSSIYKQKYVVDG